MRSYQGRSIFWAKYADYGGSFAVHLGLNFTNVLLHNFAVGQPQPNGSLGRYTKLD